MATRFSERNEQEKSGEKTQRDLDIYYSISRFARYICERLMLNIGQQQYNLSTQTLGAPANTASRATTANTARADDPRQTKTLNKYWPGRTRASFIYTNSFCPLAATVALR